MQPDANTSTGPGHLRHALRTPLNHIIGYSEMMLEEFSDAVFATDEDTIVELKAIVFNARELVRFVQNALASGKAYVSGSEVRDLQLWLQPHVTDLLGHVAALEAAVAETHKADVSRIRSAAEQLLAFTHGNISALGESPRTDEPATVINKNTEARGHVLVVDDSPVNRDLLRRILEREGYRTSLVSDGNTALQKLRESRFDLILLDVLMPGMSGFEVLQSIRSSGDNHGAPVIMISALDEGSSVIRCMQMGAEDYFIKPFDPILLRTRIEIALDRRRLREKLSTVSQKIIEIAEAQSHGDVYPELSLLAEHLRNSK